MPPRVQTLSDQAKYRLRWRLKARPNQLTPPGDWDVWLILAGRGFGKTRTGAEDFAAYGVENPGSRLAIVARTFSDARDTCVEGESGLLSCLAPSLVATWNRSIGELVLANGTRYKLFSAEEPDRLRGPQHHRAWCDEIASWERIGTWDQLMFGLRLGAKPQTVVTTTPQPIDLLVRLTKQSNVHITRGSTFENAANLAPSALAELLARYEGTRLGRQELYAEILEDVEGALWTAKLIEDHRLVKPPQRRDLIDNDWVYSDDIVRKAMGVDPAATSGPDSDETGIVIDGVGADKRGYVLADLSCRLSPDGWGRRVVQGCLDHGVDVVVLETNQGGQMAEQVIRTAAQHMGVTCPRIKMVHATQSKRLRAEPVAALYEQGRVSHVGHFPALEDEMTKFTPDCGFSPDHLDAHVHALTELMVIGQRRLRFTAV